MQFACIDHTIILSTPIWTIFFTATFFLEKIPFALDVGCGSGQATVDLSP